MSKSENIELTLPINSAYVSVIRLTASSIANRMDFNIDDIEDIKAIVSEAYSFIINKSNPSINKEFKIIFIIKPDELDIEILSENMQNLKDIEDEMGLMLIKALSDKLIIDYKDGNLQLKIKKIKKNEDYI